MGEIKADEDRILLDDDEVAVLLPPAPTTGVLMLRVTVPLAAGVVVTAAMLR
jgi:hypothetical protein